MKSPPGGGPACKESMLIKEKKRKERANKSKDRWEKINRERAHES